MTAELKHDRKVRAADTKIKKILGAVGGSGAASKALELATEPAGLNEAELLIVRALSDVVADPMSMAMLGTGYGRVSIGKSFSGAARKAAQVWLQQVVEQAQLSVVEKIRAEVLHRPGKSTVDIIVKFAKENEIDPVMLGTTGKGSFMRLLLGSVANGVLNYAPCSVLTVR